MSLLRKRGTSWFQEWLQQIVMAPVTLRTQENSTQFPIQVSLWKNETKDTQHTKVNENIFPTEMWAIQMKNSLKLKRNGILFDEINEIWFVDTTNWMNYKREIFCSLGKTNKEEEELKRMATNATRRQPNKSGIIFSIRFSAMVLSSFKPQYDRKLANAFSLVHLIFHFIFTFWRVFLRFLFSFSTFSLSYLFWRFVFLNCHKWYRLSSTSFHSHSRISIIPFVFFIFYFFLRLLN